MKANYQNMFFFANYIPNALLIWSSPFIFRILKGEKMVSESFLTNIRFRVDINERFRSTNATDCGLSYRVRVLCLIIRDYASQSSNSSMFNQVRKHHVLGSIIIQILI